MPRLQVARGVEGDAVFARAGNVLHAVFAIPAIGTVFGLDDVSAVAVDVLSVVGQPKAFCRGNGPRLCREMTGGVEKQGQAA